MKMETIERVRLYIGQKAPKPVYMFACFIRKIYKQIRMPEHRKSYGDLNPDKVFYVIRLFPPGTGWLANYNYVLGHMKYAYEKNWIPVVDMENYGTLYQESEPVHGTKNVWEYIFMQPYDKKTERRYSLEEVYQSKNVILSNGSKETYSNQGDVVTLGWQSEMAELIPFRDEVMSIAMDVYRELFSPTRKKQGIIGAEIRGTDLSKKVVGHCIQATAEEIIQYFKEVSVEWGEDNLFIVAEEAKDIDVIRQSDINVFFTDTQRVDGYDGKTNAAMVKNMDSYSKLVDYVVNVWCLSKCDSLIGTMNNGMYTALIWNGGKYYNIKIINKGIYK